MYNEEKPGRMTHLSGSHENNSRMPGPYGNGTGPSGSYGKGKDTDATLPAGAWKDQATIPFVDGVNAVKRAQEESRLSFGPGDAVGNFTLTRFLCHGERSTLFLAVDRRQERVVVKLYEPGCASTSMALRKLSDVLRRRGCPSLMPLVSFGDRDEGVHYEVMPVYQEGTLEGVVFTEEELVARILPQLNEAVRFLGENHLVHNDIKPSNLFWKDRSKMEIVLGDYDCLTFDKEEKAGGTLLYMAPERIFSRGLVHVNASDVCSMGLTLSALLMGRTLPDDGADPDPDNTEEMKTFLYRRWQRPVALPPDAPVSARTRGLVGRMLQQKPEERCGTEYIASWIENGGVAVTAYQEKARKKVINGLRWQDRLILDIPELIMALGTEWEFGTFMLRQHKLDDFIRQFDGSYYAFSQEYASLYDNSAGLFMLMQSIAPSRDFYWRGQHYESLEDFVDRTETEESYGVKDPFCHFCRAGLLSFYEQKNGAKEEQIARAKEIETLGRRQPELAVRQLQISLRQKPDYVWHGTTLAGIDDLFSFFEAHREEVDELVSEFYESKAARVWLDYIGQGSFLSQVEKEMLSVKVNQI